MKTVDALVDALLEPALAVSDLSLSLGSAPGRLIEAGAPATARRLRKIIEGAPLAPDDHEAIMLRCAIGFLEPTTARAHAAHVTDSDTWGRSMLARIAELEGDRKTVDRIVAADPTVWLGGAIQIATRRGDVARVRVLTRQQPKSHQGPVSLAVAEVRALISANRRTAARRMIAALAKHLDSLGRKRQDEFEAWEVAAAQGWHREAAALSAGGLSTRLRTRDWFPHIKDVEQAGHLLSHGAPELAGKVGKRFDAFSLHRSAIRAHAHHLLGQRDEARQLAAMAELELTSYLNDPDDNTSHIFDTAWMWHAMGDTARAISTIARGFAAGWEKNRIFQSECLFDLALATARSKQRATPAILAAVAELRAALA